MNNSSIVIESRVQLFSTLAEAAEIEHNFMCLYLYAMFGIKRAKEEGLNDEELEAVERWRRVILGISLEEMNHLCLVSNLFIAMGSTPHFGRPNFPAYPGMYPANIVVELAKFDMATLDHFIFLERPRSHETSDGANFVPEKNYVREAFHDRLMPHAGDYETVGELYNSLFKVIEDLCGKIGEKQLFCGNPSQQIGPLDSPLPGLVIVKDKASAFQALETIIKQGEGATEEENSHFARFCGIKKEYIELLKKNPTFDPSRPVVRNPVMRKPLDTEHRILVDEPLAARYMDLANALYTFMLKILTQIYSLDHRAPAEKKELLEVAYTLMHSMATVGETLTHMPVSTQENCGNAGMSFALNRSMAPLCREGELVIMSERVQQIQTVISQLTAELSAREKENPHIRACLEQLATTEGQMQDIAVRAKRMANLTHPGMTLTSSSSAGSLAEVAKSSNAVGGIEIAESEAISVSFEGRKCMHARHCVTQLPGVFLANTPGKWILPEKAFPEELASVIRQCPSGALKYKSKISILHDEAAPPVNVLRLRENGPYALLADLQVDGKQCGYRATLCRCGKSQNKPFCDSTHVTEKFKASGEPDTIDATELQSRGGPLKIQRTNNGPLQIDGNLELCAGTGRVVLRTESVRLCRCGNSKSKPVCDSSHIAAGFKDKVDTPPLVTPGLSPSP